MLLRLGGHFTIDTRDEAYWNVWTEKVADGTRSLKFALGYVYFGMWVRVR